MERNRVFHNMELNLNQYKTMGSDARRQSIEAET